MLGEHFGNSPWGKITHSETESAAFGLRVGRLALRDCTDNLDDLADVMRAKALDLLILRYPTRCVGLFAPLNRSPLVAIQADTLLEFIGRPMAEVTEPHESPYLRNLEEDAASEVQLLLQDVFGGYQNHYSANPLLAHYDSAAAYYAWALDNLRRGSAKVAAASDSEGDAPWGIAVYEEHGSSMNILLAGVVPAVRRQGRYSRLLLKVSRGGPGEVSKELQIATQASNIAVMRAWVRLGLLPNASWNTVHILWGESIPSRMPTVAP